MLKLGLSLPEIALEKDQIGQVEEVEDNVDKRTIGSFGEGNSVHN